MKLRKAGLVRTLAIGVVIAGGVFLYGPTAINGNPIFLAWFKPADTAGSNRPVTDFCDYAVAQNWFDGGSEGFCLRGDGGHVETAGYAPGAVGSPATASSRICPNGPDCSPLPSLRLNGSTQYLVTPALSTPQADHSMCALVRADNITSGGYLVGKWGSSSATSQAELMYLDGATKNLAFTVRNEAGTQTTHLSSSVVWQTGALHLSCVTYQYVGGAANNVVRTFIDGVEGASSSVMGIPKAANTRGFAVGAGADGLLGWTQGDFFGAFYLKALLTPTQMAALAAVVVYRPPTLTNGTVLTIAATSGARTCAASTGEVSMLPAGRDCRTGWNPSSVDGGLPATPGVRVRGSVANLIQRSEDLGTIWGRSNTTTTVDQATAPNGTLTADLVASTLAGGSTSSSSTTVNGGAYNCSAWVRSVSGTQAATIELSSTGATGTTDVTATTTWQRVGASVASTTNGQAMTCKIYAGGKAGTGSVYVWGVQVTATAYAQDYCRAELSATNTCAAESLTVPKPSTLTQTEGCSYMCLAPDWTGANPYGGGGQIYLDGNPASGVARFLYSNAASPDVSVLATVSASATAGYTAGTSKCYLTRWSAAAGTLKVKNVASGSESTAASFTTYPALAAAFGIAAPNATVGEIRFGSGPNACGAQ